MLDDLPKPTLFAHRGASAYAPENTLSAFETAINQGADAIELDVKLSADGEVVVIHDDTVNRTTEGDGKITNLDLATLKELDAGISFDESFRGEKIPTLREVFEEVGNRIFMNVEIANYAKPYDQLPEKTAQIVEHHGLADRIIFSSFNPLALYKIRKSLANVPTGLLTPAGKSGYFIRMFFGRLLHHDAIHPEQHSLNENLIGEYHHKGLKVHPYTVNNFDRMVELFIMGVDGIFTDDIPLAQKARTLVSD